MSLIVHKKAGLDYEVIERFDAGIELLGYEVKSVRGKLGKLEGSHVIVRGGEAFLVGAYIPPYQPGNTPKDYDPQRTRRLLLTKKELRQLADAESQKGLTIVPFSMYNKGRKIKVEINVVRGRKKYDKRAVLKKRDTEREMRRDMAL